MNEWKKVRLGEITKDGRGYYGIGASAVPLSPEKYTYLRITDINDDGTLNRADLKSVDAENAGDYLLSPNDVVFARTGNSTGRNYFYDGRDGAFVYAGFLIKFSIDSTKINPKYVKYFLQTKEYWDWVSSFNTGSTRGNINAQTYANLEIPLLPPTQQDSIANILSSLDDKIECNNRINRNLEEQAQALFKRWFIDFEFPDTNGNPYRSSGGEMTHSTLGEIPKGWEVGKLYDIADVIYGAPYKSQLFNNKGKGMPLIRIRDLKTYFPQFFTTEILPNTEYIRMGDIVAGMDAEFIPTIWQGKTGLLNQRVCKFKSNKDNVSNMHIYFAIKPHLEFIQFHKVGTTVSHMGKSDIDRILIVIPNNEILCRYFEYSAPILQKILNLSKQNQTLATLRDSLLPKLMNNEIATW